MQYEDINHAFKKKKRNGDLLLLTRQYNNPKELMINTAHKTKIILVFSCVLFVH